jgi:hypothetical protein
MTTPTLYAAIDPSDPAVAIYGLGTSPEQARANANDERIREDGPGNYRIVEITEGAWNYYNVHADTLQLSITGRGVSLRSE